MTDVDREFAANVFGLCRRRLGEMTNDERDYVEWVAEEWPDFDRPVDVLNRVCGILMRVDLRRPGGADRAPASLLPGQAADSQSPQPHLTARPRAESPLPAPAGPSLFREAMIAADQEFGALAWTVIAFLGLAVGFLVLWMVTP